MFTWSRWRCVALAMGVALLAPADGIGQMACDPCTIGVVLDGPLERNDEVRGIFEREILDLVGSEFNVAFPDAKRRVADWSLTGVATAVDALLADPEVHLVLTVGPVASTYAGRFSELPKPLVATFVIDPEVQGIPTATSAGGDRVSGVPNLSYITFPSNLEENVRRLREVAPFRHMTFLTNEGRGGGS